MSVDEMEYRPPRERLVPAGGVEMFERDMTVIASAEVPLGEVQRRLGEVGQWVPIDGEPSVGVGALVEGNSTGPLRLGYGAWRDLLLGCQFTNGRGELITAGGRTVKNVAGYDLTKFMVGQRGVFGRIETITTRTYRRPAGALVVRLQPEVARLKALLTTALRPQWVILTREALTCGYLGDEATLAFYAERLAGARRRSVEEDVAERVGLFGVTGEGAFRASVPPSRIGEFIGACEPGRWAADAAFGVVRGAGAEEGRVREAAMKVGGTVAFEGRVEWPMGEAERAVLVRLKEAFDREGTLRAVSFS